MPETPTVNCSRCGRPKSVGNKASLTQWIVACNCVEGAPDAPAAEPVDICSKCKKRISGGRAGSFTQWVFRSDLCNCEVPEAMRPSLDFVPQEQFESIAEEENELLLEGEPPFPLDRYKPLLELGKGTSGHVYLCRDRLLQKRVAIKCLWAVTPEQLIGFQREAKATSLLSHPGVVSVLDFGGTAGGAPYMVMEYVEGTSLFDHVSEHGPLPVEVALRVFRGVAEALKHAHERGVFHRDVKSANILLIHNNTKIPDVRVIDFGVAGVKQAIHTPDYQGDTIVGTPAYMSPDQAQGLPYDQRSEIYSLGCVMYETLTGSPPFSSDSALETISKHAHESAPALADSDCDRVFAPELEAIVACCLEKDPAARFQSMNQLIDALQDLEGVRQERTIIDSSESVRGSNRNLKLIAITGGVVLALGTIGVFALNVLDPETLRQVKLLFSSHSEAESKKLTDEAWEAIESDDNDKAIKLATRAIEKDDTNYRALDTRAVAYFMAGDIKNALIDLNKVINDSTADQQTCSSAQFHRDVVYIALGKKLSQKTYIPSSNNTYVPNPWESKAFGLWIKQDWRLLPLSAPGQVGGDPKNWPKDIASSPFRNVSSGPFKKTAKSQAFDEIVKEFDKEAAAGHPPADAAEQPLPPGPPLRPGPGFFRHGPPMPPMPPLGPRPGAGFRRPGMFSYDKKSISMIPQQATDNQNPPSGEEVDDFSGVNNFAYAGPNRVKVTALASDKDIDLIVADRKIENLTFSRVPISPAVLSRIRVLPLKCLALQDYRATDKDLEFIRDFKRLDHFVLSHGLGTGSFLSNLPANTMVDLVLRAMKNLNPAELEHIRKLKHLDFLSVNSCEKIGNSDMRVATEIPKLEILMFTPRFDKNPLYHNKKLELAVMPNSRFDYYNVDDIKKITSRPALRKLALDSDGLKDGAYDVLANCTVSELILQGARDIKQANLKKLAKNKRIRELYLCGDVIHENSAIALGDFHNLTALYLFHTDLGQKTFDAMSKIKVGDVVIVNEGLNSATVQNLSALKSVGRIKIVDQSIKVTPKDIDALREKLPNCKVKLKDQQ